MILERGDNCTTPNNEIATCIDIADCKVMQDAIGRKLFGAYEFAQKSKCGYASDNAMLLCCGTTGVFKVEPTLFDLFEKPKEKAKEINVHKLKPVGPLKLPDLSVCGTQRDTPKIFGGVATDMDAYPWMVAIKYQDDLGDDMGFQCGGSLINRQYALTAAHCARKNGENP